jgi:hypothetical protein
MNQALATQGNSANRLPYVEFIEEIGKCYSVPIRGSAVYTRRLWVIYHSDQINAYQ